MRVGFRAVKMHVNHTQCAIAAESALTVGFTLKLCPLLNGIEAGVITLLCLSAEDELSTHCPSSKIRENQPPVSVNITLIYLHRHICEGETQNSRASRNIFLGENLV